MNKITRNLGFENDPFLKLFFCMCPDLLVDNGGVVLPSSNQLALSPTQTDEPLIQNSCPNFFSPDQSILCIRRCDSSVEGYYGDTHVFPSSSNNEEATNSHLSSHTLSFGVTTAPHSNVPIFVIPYCSLQRSSALPVFSSIAENQRYCFSSQDSATYIISNNSTDCFEDFSDFSSACLHDLHSAGSCPCNCSPSLCSSDGDEIPRIDYHTIQPSHSFIVFPDMTLPPNHL